MYYLSVVRTAWRASSGTRGGEFREVEQLFVVRTAWQASSGTRGGVFREVERLFVVRTAWRASSGTRGGFREVERLFVVRTAWRASSGTRGGFREVERLFVVGTAWQASSGTRGGCVRSGFLGCAPSEERGPALGPYLEAAKVRGDDQQGNEQEDQPISKGHVDVDRPVQHGQCHIFEHENSR